ncbi:hypothetical protein PHMEG_00020946 [Phytophthora megakarya]|uniref:Uncharacterized protein n=1 Tax=Phytophthora megakarya TaxID=4795 RepID=A0A225VMI4_9STRA|nr:hypothetical protein PHMEG_00020946 [Phytophthora megakarya]
MFEATRQVFGGNPRRKLYKTDENTIAVKFGTVYHCEGDTVVPLSLISTQHRFEGPDRTVFAWRCLVEGEGEFTGTCLDETGWCVLRPTSSESDSTDIRTCIRSTPVRRGSDNAIKVEERDEEFATAVIRSSQQDSLKLTQLMDQLLLNSEDNQ